jgi:hypothetical protein
MASASVLYYIIGIAVLAFIVYRQLSVRRVRDSYRLVIILAVIGVLELSRFLGNRNGSHIGDGKIALALALSAILAAGMGVLRAMTVRLWRSGDGQLLRQGSWLTATLWVVAVAAHLALDALVAGGAGDKKGDIGNATIALYLAVSFGVQQMVMLKRAERAETDLRTPADPASVNGRGTHVG